MVFLQIEPDNGLAIYDQIVRQVKFAVADQVIEPGERVPSVRELARQLTVNPNTVARAYRQLQDEGILESVRGLGMQVTAVRHAPLPRGTRRFDPHTAAAGAGGGSAERPGGGRDTAVGAEGSASGAVNG